MSVINNKGSEDYGVTSLQVIERFPTAVAREEFASEVTTKLKSAERVDGTDVYNLTYTLGHTITFRPVTEISLRTIRKSYTLKFPLRLTTPPAEGTEPEFADRLTLGNEVFTNYFGDCPAATFHKYTRNLTFEYGLESEINPTNPTPGS